MDNIIDKQKLLDFSSRLIKIDSSLQDSNDWPTKNQIKVLEEFVKIAKELNFETKLDAKGRWAWAEIGSGKELLGIIGHLDVVPGGDKKDWNSDPFDVVEKDGFLYGRGTIDDKGPTVISMLVLDKILKEHSDINKRIRIIVTNDEEILWRGIEAYKKTEEIPSIAFTPDSAFPLTYAEKELLDFYITGKGVEDIEININHPLNVVAPEAIYKGKYIDEISKNAKENKFKFKVKADTITFIGESKHAKDAADGHTNALVNLVNSLPSHLDEKVPIIKFIKENVKDGQAINVFGNIEDKVSGKLTFNAAQLFINKKEQKLGVDSRIPVTNYDSKKFEKEISSKLKNYNLKFEKYDSLPRVYFPLDSELIISMMNSYQKISKDTKTEPISSGGATFARAIPNCLAFGPKFPNEESSEHMPNEKINIENFMKAGEIYYDFISKYIKK